MTKTNSKIMNLPKFLMSSADPTQVATTVKGFILAVTPLIILTTGLNQADVTAGTQAIIDGIMAVTTMWGAAKMVYGIARKMRLGRWTAAE
jgi:hypothetical protein